MKPEPLKMTPAAVLFDLDGTLIDTAPDFIRVVNAQRQQYGLQPLSSEQIRNSVSNGARALINLSFGLDVDDPGYAEKHTELLDMYLAGLAMDTVLFPGMDKLISALESIGIPWGIVTNKPRRFTDPLLDQMALQNRCGVTVCPDDVTNRKPDPEPLLLACTTLKVEPRNCIYVGDHIRDIEAGKRAEMYTVAARFGYINEPAEVSDWGADLIVDHAQELHDFLQQYL
ncbi:phosphoglycolate phosphatase [Oleiphilus messinensis]|uniref:Phosphoglycolate phosphatase n=2 Tax=Oleiphilus messinensis TaxID=141451 RepID=A0A1Y0IAD5_9GAMM|nr:phosphoglycolate phosphatase [Oleiphilus messinensis]